MSCSVSRLARTRSAMKEAGLDALYVRDVSNIRWLTGFDGVFDSEAAHLLYVDAQRAVLHTDSRYAGACAAAARGAGIEVNAERVSHAQMAARLWDEGAVAASVAVSGAVGAAGVAGAAGASIAASVAGARAAKLGIEDSLSVAEYRRLKEALLANAGTSANVLASADELTDAARCSNAGAKAAAHSSEDDAVVFRLPLRETSDFVLGLRAVKDADEIKRMKFAQAITDAAFAHIVGFIRPGLTEREVQLELEDFMRRHGADDLAFSSIVATGANGANPHAIPGGTRLEAGQCVVLDFGARARGYCSDMTRMVFLGEPSQRMQDAYAALVCANEEVEALLRPGVTGRQAHQLAEDILAAAGFEGKMGHGLGHGVGLDIHENPSLNLRNDAPLEVGNVVTVEPGIYLSGEFGMRLEDFGVITESGFEVFTQSSHDMVIL